MELCAGGSVVWLGIKGSFSFLYGVRLCGNQFRDADQVVGDEVQQESSGDTSNPAMLSLAHRAMLLAPAKDAFDHFAALLRHAIARVPCRAGIDRASPPLADFGRRRNSYFMLFQTPRRLIAVTRSNSSPLASAVSTAGDCTPALLNAASRRPKVDTVCSIIAATSASSATLQRTAIALWSAETSSSAAERTAFSSMSASTTAAPASAKALAVARPMPEPAPVTSATLFSKDKFINEFLLHIVYLGFL